MTVRGHGGQTVSPGHCPWYRGFGTTAWTPLEVGPTPPALRPVLCWCVCACVCGRPHASLKQAACKGTTLSRYCARSRVQHRQRAACEGTSLGRWSCRPCGVRACACGVRVRRRVQASTPSVAALVGHRRGEHVEESPRGRFRRRRLGGVSNLTWPRPLLLCPVLTATLAPPIGKKHEGAAGISGRPRRHRSCGHRPQRALRLESIR